jgi:hypothetical protein
VADVAAETPSKKDAPVDEPEPVDIDTVPVAHELRT